MSRLLRNLQRILDALADDVFDTPSEYRQWLDTRVRKKLRREGLKTVRGVKRLLDELYEKSVEDREDA